ncbi:MAG TPA: arginine repressor [Clostridia bacterium]|jgi:transcriptional regulator of arginine metabolism|nr:MAG: Arginine repressor [Firmicutes bacterium ADurb.Bin146]HOD93559.1 arginine repressor [Clostridia bacterium]
MKNKRQIKILEFIEQYPVQTQDELVSLLQKNGFDATQATVCRDIKELKLFKAVNKDGLSVYTSINDISDNSHEKLIRVLKASFLSINIAQNFAVIKTLPATAPAVASAIDNLKIKNLLGTIAGDDTIFACFSTNIDSQAFYENILNELR